MSPPASRPVSSTAARLAGNPVNPSPNSNPESLHRFSLKQLGATRGARAVVYLGIFAMAVAEGAAYYKFTPRVLGWGEKDGEGNERN